MYWDYDDTVQYPFDDEYDAIAIFGSIQSERMVEYIGDEDLCRMIIAIQIRAFLNLMHSDPRADQTGQPVGLADKYRYIIKRHPKVKHWIEGDMPIMARQDPTFLRKLFNRRGRLVSHKLVWDESKDDLCFA